MTTNLKIYLPSLPNLAFEDCAIAKTLSDARFDLVQQLQQAGYGGDNILGQRPWLKDMANQAEAPDAYIFPPVAALGKSHGKYRAETSQRFFEFLSLTTGIHIGSRENYHPGGLSKPCIVIDPDNEWSKARDLLDDLRRKGVFSSNLDEIVHFVGNHDMPPKDYTRTDHYRELNRLAVETLGIALTAERRKVRSAVETEYPESYVFEPYRKAMLRHPFGVAIFGSARSKEPMYLDATATLASSIGQRGWRLVTGAGRYGCMGAADHGFDEGKKQFNQIYPDAQFKPAHVGVSTQDILRLEGPPKNLEQLIITRNIYDRMKAMIEGQKSKNPEERTRDAVKVFFIVPGGIGTLHEFFTLLQLATNGSKMDKRSIILLNTESHIGGGRFWDPLITLAKDLGFGSYFKVANDPRSAIALADEVYSEWLIEEPEHAGLPHPEM